jgi:spermidine synthase
VSPVSLRRSPGAVNTYLEVLLYRNQLQLATTDALYSDGNRYLPAVAALNHLKASLPSVNTVLVLGAGLGSMVRIMHSKGQYPHFTLVEHDKVVLQWALEFLEADHTKIKPVCNSAQAFMNNNKATYDLVFIDIFNGRSVPEFVTTKAFLQLCQKSVKPGGYLIFNYIIENKHQWQDVKETFSSIFPNSHILDLGLNQVLIASS